MSQVARNGEFGQFALIALGSSLPFGTKDQISLLLSAIASVEHALGAAAVASPIYRTPAYPPGSGPDFANAVIRVPTDLDAAEILTHLHRIEAEAGRDRTRRWSPRTLDLDLLALGALVLPDVETWTGWRDLPADQQADRAPDQLILPHPRLQDRAFVLVPLCDVAPDWFHPVLGRTATALCADLSLAARAEVVAWD